MYDFYCQCVENVKTDLGRTAATQGPQGTVSTVVIDDEKRIIDSLCDIKNLFSSNTVSPALLQTFKMKSLFSLVLLK